VKESSRKKLRNTVHNHETVKDLAREIHGQHTQNARLRPGVITANALTASPPTLTIQLAGDTTNIPGVRYMEGSATAVGKKVWVWQDGPDLIVIGALA
jgi:hypothetical protein